MNHNITADGTTSIELTPGAKYIVSAEGNFDGATMVIKSAGGVVYLPHNGDATISAPDASEFFSVSGSAEIITASSGGSTDISVSLSRINGHQY